MKPDDVKIIQLLEINPKIHSALPEYTHLIGLGDDGIVYFYSFLTKQWYE